MQMEKKNGLTADVAIEMIRRFSPKKGMSAVRLTLGSSLGCAKSCT